MVIDLIAKSNRKCNALKGILQAETAFYAISELGIDTSTIAE